DACLLRRSDRLRDSGRAALGGGNSSRSAGRRRRLREGGVTMATAATRPGESVASASPFKRLARERRLLIAVAVFLVLLGTVASIGSARLTYYDLSQLAASGARVRTKAVQLSGEVS